jgi:hypothetical protein
MLPKAPRPVWQDRAAGIDTAEVSYLDTTTGELAPNSLCADALRRLRWQRYVESVHQLGARVEFEFWDEVARHHPDLVDDLDRRLARYAELDPEVLRALGADRFPASPVRAVSA